MENLVENSETSQRVLSQRGWFIDNLDEDCYSGFVLLDEGGHVSKYNLGKECCFCQLFHTDTYEESVGRYLFVGFGEDLWRSSSHSGCPEEIPNWVSWVINDSPLSYVFITKTSEEGRGQGFEVDTSKTFLEILAAVTLLRTPFEVQRTFNNKSLTEMGYSEQERLALLFSCRPGSTDLLSRGLTGFADHKFFRWGMPYSYYNLLGVDFREGPTLREGWDEDIDRPSLDKLLTIERGFDPTYPYYSGHFPDKKVVRGAFGNSKFPLYAKNNLDLILNHMKELEK